MVIVYIGVVLLVTLCIDNSRLRKRLRWAGEKIHELLHPGHAVAWMAQSLAPYIINVDEATELRRVLAAWVSTQDQAIIGRYGERAFKEALSEEASDKLCAPH